MDYIIIKDVDSDGCETYYICPIFPDSMIVDKASYKSQHDTLANAVVNLDLWRSTLGEIDEAQA